MNQGQLAPPQVKKLSPAAKAVVIILAIAYILWPIDLSTLYGAPDIVPILGWLDDAVAAYFAFRTSRA